MTEQPTDPCRVCGAPSRFAFAQPVLGRPVRYFECDCCGYLQTETPYWLDEAYSSAINSVDTGIMQRNVLNVGRVVMTLHVLGSLRGRVVDHAGGYGILVRMLRDAGVDARWRDIYCENILARGFEADEGRCDLLTAFEVFEHLVHPLQELESMLREAPAVLISTDLVTTASTPPGSWWYYGPEHGQHVGFFRSRTLAWMAQHLRCHCDTDGQALHVFSRHPIPPHWKLMVRLRRLWPFVARLHLASKTNTDFDQLRRKLGNKQ